MKKSYSPTYISKSKSWSEIISFYRNLNEVHGWNIQPMVQLVEAINSSHYANGIFALTSHAKLCISQSKVDFERNLLTIEFIDERFIFIYRESIYSNEWVKESDAQSGFNTFEHIMKRLKWFLN